MLALCLLVVSLALAVASVPSLNIAGFSWAENLAFDGLGGLFVTESVRGEMWRIALTGGNYSAAIHISKGFKQFGGLAPAPDGQSIYAAAVFEDGSNGIIRTSTAAAGSGEQSYAVIAKDMANLNNGMALVPAQQALYGTCEKGTLVRVDIATGTQTLVTDSLSAPDGLWYDEASALLFIGELYTKRMVVYDVSTGGLSEPFAGASSLSSLHLLDDLTLVGAVDKANLGATMIAGADWSGKQIITFSLDGSVIRTVPAPVDLYEPTSIRRGKGPGFDSSSFYVTEGGGLTGVVKSRRVLQLAPGAI